MAWIWYIIQILQEMSCLWIQNWTRLYVEGISDPTLPLETDTILLIIYFTEHSTSCKFQGSVGVRIRKQCSSSVFMLLLLGIALVVIVLDVLVIIYGCDFSEGTNKIILLERDVNKYVYHNSNSTKTIILVAKGPVTKNRHVYVIQPWLIFCHLIFLAYKD